MALTRVAPAGIGSTPGTGYVIGDSFLHSRGLNATDGYYTGIVTTQSLRVIGDLEVEGTTTTLDTALTEVDKLEVGANNNTVGVAITQSGTGDILRLYDGTTQAVTVKDGGNVLVGTTDATIYNNGDSDSEGIVLRNGEVIDIARKGDLQLTLNRQTNDGPHIGFFRSGSPKTYISTRNDAFCIDTGGLNERLRIHSDGKFSFGTETASTAKYTFNSAGTNEVARFESTDTGAYLAIKDSSSTSINFVEGGGDVLSLGVNSVERLRITTSGVGIGTDDPQKKLHVSGTSDFVVDTNASALRIGSYGEYDIALATGRNTLT